MSSRWPSAPGGVPGRALWFTYSGVTNSSIRDRSRPLNASSQKSSDAAHKVVVHFLA